MLPTKRSAIALARGARTGVWIMRTSRAVKTASKAAVNFGVAVPDEEPEATTGVVEIHCEVTGLLGQPGARRVRGDTEDVHAAGGVLDNEEGVQPAQDDGVQMKQIAGHDPMRLCAQELGPRGSGSSRRWVDAGVVEDVPDRGGAELVAEAGEFAVDPSVSPGGVVGGQTNCECADADGDGWSTEPGGLGGPAPSDEQSVPAQDCGRCDEQPEAAADR
jgi:hypothetical protein